MSWLFIIILIILIAVFFIYINNIKIENYNDSNSVKIILFYATWCGHCHRYLESNIFMDTYDTLKNNPKYKNINFEMIDFDKNKELANKYNINSFPTIISVNFDGTLIKIFEGNRNNKDHLKKFVDDSL